MSFKPTEYLEKGDIEFLRDMTDYDHKNIIKSVRNSERKLDIINGFIKKGIKREPGFTFEIIYDIEKYKKEVFNLINKHSFLDLIYNKEKLKNILNNTTWGKHYILDNYDEIISTKKDETINWMLEYAFKDLNKNEDLVEKISRSKDLHIRYLFMKYTIENHPDKLYEIYDDILKYLSEYNYEENEQLTLFPKLMANKDISNLAISCLNSNLDKSVYINLKEHILNNYKENDLAKHLLSPVKTTINYVSKFEENTNGIEEFKKDSDRLFLTSSNYQLVISNRFSEYVSKNMVNNFIENVKHFESHHNYSYNLEKLFHHNLGRDLVEYVEKYLSLSKNKTTEYLTQGTTSTCFRIGDYVIKLVNTKWSYEDEICPNLYLILKNEEEKYVRDHKKIVVAGIEVQKYLSKTANHLPHGAFSNFDKELKNLGYYTNDTLIGGTHGDNCMLLDSYKDADHYNPELLPESFKETPLVLVDRDTVYKLENKRPRQLQSGRY